MLTDDAIKCERCVEYERSIRGIRSDLEEAMALLESGGVDALKLAHLSRTAREFRKQLGSAEIALRLHRQLKKCSDVNVA